MKPAKIATRAELAALPLWPAASGWCLALDPALYGEAFKLLSKVVLTAGGCWEWTAAKIPSGYGRYRIGRALCGEPGGQMEYSHRASHRLFKGPIPASGEIDHVRAWGCQMGYACANPGHLEVVDRRTNLMRGDTVTRRNAEKDRCPQGHDIRDEANVARDKAGHRRCRTCHRLACNAAGKRKRRAAREARAAALGKESPPSTCGALTAGVSDS